MLLQNSLVRIRSHLADQGVRGVHGQLRVSKCCLLPRQACKSSGKSLRSVRHLSTARESPERMVEVPESRLQELIHAEIAYLESVPIRAVSMQEVLDCLDPPRIAKFIQNDNVKRLAFRIRLIESLSCWKRVPELVQIHDDLSSWYRSLSFAQRGRDIGLKDFTSCICEMRHGGREHLLTASIGMHKVKSSGEYDDDFLNKWMDSFFMSRIGSNMLLDQYYACAGIDDGGLGKPLGIVNPRCNPTTICEKAALAVSMLCKKHTGHAPPYSVETYRAGENGPQVGVRDNFSYIPGFLKYIMMELLKNSFNATVKNAVDEDHIKNSPIHILVSTDAQSIVIRVSDRAGGIPSEVGDQIWSYLYGAAAKDDVIATPLAGYGVGLPLSRLYAKYLGGQLEIRTFPAFGTDAYLFLRRLVTEQVEELPSSVSTSQNWQNWSV